MKNSVETAAKMIREVKHSTAFTGAGISVESGIPPFRGPDGLWSKYDPVFLEISYFMNHPRQSWKLIKEIFYDYFGKARPNPAHFVLAEMETSQWLHSIITQNIDNLHQEAGSQTVYEFHGTSQTLVCIDCGKKCPVNEIDLGVLPPLCPVCSGLLKPDFVFFGEPIPAYALENSIRETEIADLFLVIGTTGEIMPASTLPFQAKSNGAKIVEINTVPSAYTHEITDIFLQGKASVVMQHLLQQLKAGNGNNLSE